MSVILLHTTAMHYQANEDEEDPDALDELIELLQASSETHSDDDDAWASFRKEIIQRREDYLKGEDARKVSQCSHVSYQCIRRIMG